MFFISIFAFNDSFPSVCWLCFVNVVAANNMQMVMLRGGSRIFSRGGGADFQKIFQNFDLFFLGRPN